MIIVHIVAALLSITVTTLAWMRPSHVHLHSAYILAGATLGTGVYLVVTTPSHMLHACVVGVAYVVIVLPLTLLARQRLRLVTVRDRG